jgi:Fe-S-cluster containining protein
LTDSRAKAIQAEAAREAAALWPMWFDAARREAVDAAIAALHDELDAAVAQRGATCWQSGDCCRFDEYGHRLYVTGLEAAWFLRQAQPAQAHTDSTSEPAAADTLLSLPVAAPARTAPPTEQPACPYQIDNRCTVHAIRPMGCRVFFCEPGTEQWQRETYERFHTRMRELHDTHGIAYRYMEWRAELEEAAGFHPRGETGKPPAR